MVEDTPSDKKSENKVARISREVPHEKVFKFRQQLETEFGNSPCYVAYFREPHKIEDFDVQKPDKSDSAERVVVVMYAKTGTALSAQLEAVDEESPITPVAIGPVDDLDFFIAPAANEDRGAKLRAFFGPILRNNRAFGVEQYLIRPLDPPDSLEDLPVYKIPTNDD